MTPNRFLRKDATGMHYAVRVLIGTTALWLLLRALGDNNPLWAIISFVVVIEPELGATWLTFKSRTINTAIGCATGLVFLVAAGPQGWVLPLALTATVLICTYVVILPVSWRLAPITAAIVLTPSLLDRSTASGVQVALRRTGEVFLGSAMALIVTHTISKVWALAALRQGKEDTAAE